MIVIRTFTDPDYAIRTTLDGREWALAFRWNQRADRWIMAIGEVDQAPYRAGIMLTCTVDLLRRWRGDPNLPAGLLFVTHGEGNNSPPSRYDFGPGLRTRLVYFPLVAQAADNITVRIA